MNWYFKVLRKYAVFSGRARRSEYWFFFLFNLLFTLILTAIDISLDFYNAEAGIGVLSGIYALFVLIPSIAVTVRRLHDTGRTGWWFLIVLVPVLGALVLLFFMVLDSERGTNEFGPHPKNPLEDSL
ncbi:DUF805 domain-containing protein [Microbulbifer yueqingensis]|uniref:Uncharacterized membrane protein YhaH, DUF805 family n=1 Tax=Microbulbifer yueqingensis TaxID=658219 RepID=A0A1G9CL41_9GAMM|nr:DUF805 domain-containing protein [Microbulbifer yueqingensis]SDK52423.1 Uncharacterized membrane protein YhaH, DUF805 family [Microbulbifer yueqingensis]